MTWPLYPVYGLGIHLSQEISPSSGLRSGRSRRDPGSFAPARHGRTSTQDDGSSRTYFPIHTPSPTVPPNTPCGEEGVSRAIWTAAGICPSGDGRHRIVSGKRCLGPRMPPAPNRREPALRDRMGGGKRAGGLSFGFHGLEAHATRTRSFEQYDCRRLR